jgi:hypothetical protein
MVKYAGWLIFFALIVGAAPLEAKVFSNSYIRFQMPDQWGCRLENTAWICRHRVAQVCQRQPKSGDCPQQIKRSREALVIFTAKETSNVDSLKAYLTHFQEPRPIKPSKGNQSQSQVIHTKAVKIGRQNWVDSMHLSSELPNYYTRYLATIRGNVAVLVTLSAHKKYYTNYSSHFFKAIKTLEVTASELSKVDKKELGNKVLSRPIQLPDDLMDGIDVLDESHPSNSTSTLLFLAAMLLAALGVFIWWKNKD